MTQVLLVDNDKDIRDALRLLFEDAGYQVYDAPDGKPALDRLRGSAEGMVVVLNLNMPGMDGAQVLDAVTTDSALTRRHAFVLLTASARILPLEFAHVLKQHNIRTIVKPFDIDDLLDAAEAAARRLTLVRVIE